MHTFNEWTKNKKLKTIKVTCRDGDDTLEELLKYIKISGNCGHSFSIIVDQDDEKGGKKFYWDGDGSDYIKDININ
jgi:tRNA A22 N-methylase